MRLVSAAVLLTALSVTSLAYGQVPVFGQYQVDSLLTQTYQAQLDTFTTALSNWNRARGALQDGRFVDIEGTVGALDLLRRSWAALEARQLNTVRELEGQIGQLQARTAIVGMDGQNWVGVGFVYTQGSWNGVRFSKPDRVRQNFDQVVVSKLLALLNQAPKAPQIAGLMLHYAYVYYTTVSRPQTHFGEEVQFRIPVYYVEQFLTQRITTDQLLGATNIVVKSQEDQVAQRMQLGSAPPAPPPVAQPSPPSPAAAQPAPVPATQPPAAAAVPEQPRFRAIREITAGREFGTLLIGDVVVFRITTAFEGRSQFQRAELVVEKLNRLLAQGLRPEEVKSGSLSGRYVILARDEILITIDDGLARNNATSPSALAALWAKRIQDALNQVR